MKDTSGEDGIILDKTGATVFIRIAVPDLKVQKCLQFQLEQTVWQAKQRILTAFAKDLKDALNYGLFLPPANGRAGKFMEEERTLSEYPIQGPIGFLEFKYKRRVYKLMQVSDRKLKQIHSKAKLKAFMEYVRAGNTSKINKLTLKGLDPNFHDTDNGETPLTTAVTLGKSKVREVIITLISGGAHVDFRNKQGLTALHRAAIVGNAEAIRTMLDLGASPNCRDGRDLTPLYYSVSNDDSLQECTHMLLHERACIGVCDEQGWYEIHQACKYGRVQHLEHLLFYGAEMDVRNSCGNTPLHVCALNNQEACARVLLFRGADPSILNYNNQSADQAAAMAGNTAIATMITSHNPDDVVPYREIPQFSDRRKGASLTPSLRALMRSRSDPRINIVGLDSRSTSASSSPRGGLARRQNIRTGMVDWDSACSLSVSSYGSVAGMSDHGTYNGRTLTGLFPGGYASELSMRKAGSVDHLDSVSRAVNRYNTLGTLVPVDRVQKPRVVLLHRCAEGYGFVLRGAKSKLPTGGGFSDFTPTAEYPALQYLDSVDPGSQADRAGLKGGDFILEINGENVVRASHEHVVHLIRSSSDVLTLKVATVGQNDRSPADWFSHQDSGAMTLPTRKKLAAPLPPQRDPRTSLSYSKASSRSMAEGLAEIEKLDAAIAQFEGDDSLRRHSLHALQLAEDPKMASLRAPHTLKRVSNVDYDDLSSGDSGLAASTSSKGNKDYIGPAEARIKKMNKKPSPQMAERSKSTPDILAAIDNEQRLYGGNISDTWTKGQASHPHFHGMYSSGTLQPSQTRDVSKLFAAPTVDSGPHYQKRSAPSTPELPRRKPTNQLAPSPLSEVVQINTAGKNTTYANISSEIANQKKSESHYESSFRPGVDAKLSNNQVEAKLNPDQIMQKNKNSDKSISFADDKVLENTYKFLQKYPNATVLVTADIHTDKHDDNKDEPLYEPDPDYNDSDDDDKSFVSNTEKYGKTIDAVCSKVSGNTREDKNVITDPSRLNKTSVTVISVANEANKQMPPSGSHSSLNLTASGRSSPLPARLNDNTASPGSSSRRSSGVVTATPSQLSSAESSRRSSTQSNFSADFSDKNSKVYSISSVSTNKSEDNFKNVIQGKVPQPPAGPPPPPAPPPPPSHPPPPPPPPPPATFGVSLSQEDGANSTIRRRPNNDNPPSVLAHRISQEDLLAAVAERQTRLETDGPRVSDVKSAPANKSTLDLNQEALKAAVAKRKTLLEQEDNLLVSEIEARLNRNKKLQAAKYFVSNVNKNRDVGSKNDGEISASPAERKLAAEPEDETDSVKPKDIVARFEPNKPASQIKMSPVVPVKNIQNAEKLSPDNKPDKIYSSSNPGNGGAIDYRAHLKHVDVKSRESAHAVQSRSEPSSEVSTSSSSVIKTDGKAPVPLPSKAASTVSSSAKTKTELNLSTGFKSNTNVPASPSAMLTSADYIALAEKARLEYLKKKTSGNLVPNNETKGPIEITPHKKAGHHVSPVHNSSSKVSDSSVNEIKTVQGVREKGPAHGKAGDFTDGKTSVSGVTEDHSHTEQSLSNGTIKKSKPDGGTGKSKVAPPPPGSSISKSVALDTKYSPSFGNSLESASRTSINDAIMPPPPPPPDFSDFTIDDQDAFIPPPPEFLEIDSNANESKTVDKNLKPFVAKPISIWTCADVLDWLDTLGLSEYKPSFTKARVDGTKLVEMGRSEFLNLGVSQPSHYMNLEQTVKKLNQGISTNL